MKKIIITVLIVSLFTPLISLAHTVTPGLDDGSIDHHEMMDTITGDTVGSWGMMPRIGAGFGSWLWGALAIVWLIAGILLVIYLWKRITK